jgi:hypothetical protein
MRSIKMDELNLLEKLESVKAPPGFEQRVLTQLSVRKRKRVRVRNLSLSMAGAFSAALVIFIVLNVFILPERSHVGIAEMDKKSMAPAFEAEEITAKRPTIPIIEAVDYGEEVRSISTEPRTIYLLEQVSDEVSSTIKY